MIDCSMIEANPEIKQHLERLKESNIRDWKHEEILHAILCFTHLYTKIKQLETSKEINLVQPQLIIYQNKCVTH